MKLHDIHLRDPFILPAEGKYYLYGSCGGTYFVTYISEDLEEWAGPYEVFAGQPGFWGEVDFWAPEVHAYRGKYYLFASFKAKDTCRGTSILMADTPCGPFVPLKNSAITPHAWECLDGTLYVSENGTPYIVFCHEWVQTKDGEMCAQELTPDLRDTVGEARVLFRASEPHWANKGSETFVTDGPFLYRMQDGRLLMLWSSFSAGQYVEAVAASDNGDITGKWQHLPHLLFEKDGGHGMVFRTAEGELRFIMHTPNSPGGAERPRLLAVQEKEGTLQLV